MSDKWMNIGFENDELKPHLEPKTDFGDVRRLGMVHMNLSFFSFLILI